MNSQKRNKALKKAERIFLHSFSNVMMSVCMKRAKTLTQSFSNFKAAPLENVCVDAGSLGERPLIRLEGFDFKSS